MDELLKYITEELNHAHLEGTVDSSYDLEKGANRLVSLARKATIQARIEEIRPFTNNDGVNDQLYARARLTQLESSKLREDSNDTSN